MAGEGCQHSYKWGPQPILAAAARAPAPCATPRLSSSPLAEERPRARVMTQFVQGAGSAVLARCWHPASHYYDISLTRHCSLQPPLWPARQQTAELDPSKICLRLRIPKTQFAVVPNISNRRTGREQVQKTCVSIVLP